MRLFKRSSNPIFVEEEDYNWGNKRGKGFRYFLLLVTMTVIAGIVISMVGP
tara:strand:+ start:1636 stop:1788 length:153 start_codon:yes stop_codon:yes gene_type:complete